MSIATKPRRITLSDDFDFAATVASGYMVTAGHRACAACGGGGLIGSLECVTCGGRGEMVVTMTDTAIPAEVLDAAVEAGARALVTLLGMDWDDEGTDQEEAIEAARAALTAALPGVVAAAKAEWEKPIRSLADEWDSRSAARGDYGQPDSPSHAASELRDLLDERAATYRKASQ